MTKTIDPRGTVLPAGQLTDGVRTAITGLLLLHFFALAVGVTSNRTPSGLESRLRAVPGVRPYLQLVGMDVSYQFHLTYFESVDFDDFIEADLELADGSRKAFELPPAYLWPGQRYRRYERLASRLAELSLEDEEALLARNIAARLAAEAGDVVVGTIRCPQPDLERLERAGPYAWPQDDDPFRQSFYREGYSAHLVWLGGRVEVMRTAPAGETAPAPAAPAGQAAAPAGAE